MTARRLYRDHVEIQRLHRRLVRAVQGGEEREVLLDLCDRATACLRTHAELEHGLMERAGYPRERRKAHQDHHRLLVSFLDAERAKLHAGGDVLDLAIDVFDELLVKHAALFDNELVQLVMRSGGGGVDDQVRGRAPPAARRNGEEGRGEAKEV